MSPELLVRAQTYKDKEAMLQILESFTPKIRASLYQVPIDYREDLKQELYVAMLQVILRFELN